MRKKYNLRTIVSKRSYSTEEIAKLLDVHIQTVRTWHKEGMQPIEESSSPYLFLGSDIHVFLAKELSKQKVKLSENEFYCLRCHKAVLPTKTFVIDRGVTIGRGKESIFIVGSCPICGLEVRRFATKEQHKVHNNQQKLIEKDSYRSIQNISKVALKSQISLFEPDGGDKDY